MMRGWIIGIASCFALVAYGSTWAAEASNLFDKPLREQHLTLPPNPTDPNPQAHPRVSCYYYPDFMVKQVDLEWIKGARQLSVIRTQKGQPAAVCQRENIDSENVITDWSGRFMGVRQGYAFFSGADGSNYGVPFAVYDGETQEKIFFDVAHPLLSVEPILPPRDPELQSLDYRGLLLKYRKVYVAPCSMRGDADHCWAVIKQITGLTQAKPPRCDSAYGAEGKGAPPEQLDGIASDLSVITYIVEVVIDEQGVTRVTPKSSVLECYPAE
jgi:hypothetical protein